MAVSGAGDVCGAGGAGAGSSSAPVLRLSQNFHPLIQKNLFFTPILGIRRVLGTHTSAGSHQSKTMSNTTNTHIMITGHTNVGATQK